MTSRTCPFCGKGFSNGASYRVHKSKYHRCESLPQQQSELPEEKPITTVPVIKSLAESETVEEPKTSSNREVEEKHSDSGWGWIALLVIGLVAAPAILPLLFKRGGGGQQ